LSKVLHEFGHGLTCKHFGGECHDMGMLLLVFTPCMYCDASDAWTMPNKWHRIAISAGGIYVELVIASLASLTWWNTSEGVIHSIALALMIICSINTFVVNSNPLLRFDGYYILSDLVEIPNLRQKAQQTLRAFFHRNLFGWTSPAVTDLLSGSRRRFFLFYAVAAWLYRWLLCASVLWFFYNALKPYRLGSVSAVLAVVVALQMLVIPMWRNFRRMKKMQRQQAPRDWGRMLVGWSVVVAIVAAIVLLPIPRRVSAVLVVQGEGQHPVHVEVGGRLNEVRVLPGQSVQKGDVLGILSNPNLDLELARLEGEVQRIEALAEKHRSLGRPGEEQMAQELLQRRLAEIASRQQQRDRLTLRADSDGTVVPAARRDQQRVETSGYVQLTAWTEAPLREENLGAWLETGTTVCELRPSGEPEAVMVVEQGDVEFLEMGQPMRIKFDALPGLTVPGMIREISRKEAEEFPEQLLAAAGGELQTERGADGQITAAGTYYEVRASIDVAAIESDAPLEELLPYGSRGRAKIDCGSWTCWDLIVRQFHRLFFLG
jgi:putative peptide zinc metalloprotease protein